MLSGFPIARIAASTCSFVSDNSALFRRQFDRVFLRCEKAARISLKRSAGSYTFTGGSSRTFSRITAESTFGRGMKQFIGTFAAIYGSE